MSRHRDWMKIILLMTFSVTCLATTFGEFPSPTLLKRLAIGHTYPPVQARNEPVVYPPTYQLGDVTLIKCLEDNQYGLDGLYCHNHTVRLNRDLPIDQRKIKVAVFVHVPPALLGLSPTAPRKAMWYPLGGPGSVSHLSLNYMFTMSEALPTTWATSLVIMSDQRGMGWSCGFSCWESFVQYALMPMEASTTEDLIQMAEDFRRACLIEIGTDRIQASTSDECIINSPLSPRAQRLLVIPFMGTKHAVRDFEDFRLSAGLGKIDAVATSYGTVVIQVYCGMFPNACASMVIDSPFDSNTGSMVESATREADSRRHLLDRVAELCMENPACAVDACPEGTTDCLTIITDKINLALSPNNWPKQVEYPYFDPMTGEYAVVPVELQRHWIEYYLSSYSSINPLRAMIVRALLRASDGDAFALTQLTMFVAYGVNPTSPTSTIPIEYIMSSGIGQLSVYPMVTGEDYVYRWHHLPLITSAEERSRQMIETYGSVNLNQVMGMSPLAVQQNSPAFGSPFPPMFSEVYQNTSLTPCPGWHGNYPVIVVNPSHDSNCPSGDANNLFARYMSQPGETRRIVVIDGRHGSLLPSLPDPAVYQSAYLVDQALSTGILPETPITEIQSPLMMSNYRPRTPNRLLTSEEVPALVEDDFVMNTAFVTYFTVITSCKYGGFVYWGTMRNETHEEITFVSCASVSPYLTVDGVATYNWATPTMWQDGADFGFETVSVTNYLTGTNAVYNYLHLAGQVPIQTQYPTNQARSVKARSYTDHALKIQEAMRRIYVP